MFKNRYRFFEHVSLVLPFFDNDDAVNMPPPDEIPNGWYMAFVFSGVNALPLIKVGSKTNCPITWADPHNKCSLRTFERWKLFIDDNLWSRGLRGILDKLESIELLILAVSILDLGVSSNSMVVSDGKLSSTDSILFY